MRRVLLTTAAALAACGRPPAPAPEPQRLLIATGPAGATYLRLGEALARIYDRRLPHVRARAEPTEGSVSNVKALQERRAELAFAQANVAYEAYTKRGALRAVAALYTNALQIVARRDGPVRDVAGLARRRVGVGPAGSGTELAADIVMGAHGLATPRVDRRSLAFAEATAGVAAGALDAAFVMASVPTDAVARASGGAGLRLLSVDARVMAQIRALYPFYRPIVIPAGTYPWQPGDVHTLGVDNVLVCRADLDDDLVYRLTEVLLDSLPELARAHPSAGTVDPERAPDAPIPLHPGAKRFYRTREILR